MSFGRGTLGNIVIIHILMLMRRTGAAKNRFRIENFTRLMPKYQATYTIDK